MREIALQREVTNPPRTLMVQCPPIDTVTAPDVGQPRRPGLGIIVGLVTQRPECPALNRGVESSNLSEPTNGSVVQLAGCRSPKPTISVQIAAGPPIERKWRCVHSAVGSARACQVRGRGFESRCTLHALVVQLAEYLFGIEDS